MDEPDEDGWTALIHATVEGREEAMAALLEGGADIEKGDGEGCRPLHHAARSTDKGYVDNFSQVKIISFKVDREVGTVISNWFIGK